MKTLRWILACCAAWTCAAHLSNAQEVSKVTVGSSALTENAILGAVLELLAESAGADAKHLEKLGEADVLWQALLNGELDAYVDNADALLRERFDGETFENLEQVEAKLAELGVKMSGSIGFSNADGIGILRAAAEERGLAKISDLQSRPDLKFGFSSDFIESADGWTSLKELYKLPQNDVSELERENAYAALEDGSIDLMRLSSTDVNIQKYDLTVLEDDQGFFPKGYAVVVYRSDLEERAPKVAEAFLKLEGSIAESEMIAMSAETKLKFLPESVVANNFIKAKFPEAVNVGGSSGSSSGSGFDIEVEVDTWITRLRKNTVDHLIMVAIALAAALLASIPLGIGAARNEAFGKVVLGFVGILQTIPSLALLVFMIPLVGIGKDAAILALFFYSLLPIVQNTHAGLTGIQKGIIESAAALGLTSGARLWLVELPIALRSILAGVKIASVQLIGFATLGAFIGAGGYGQPILTGLRVGRNSLILEGAIPAALMALLAQGLFELIERSIVSKGLRIRAEE